MRKIKNLLLLTTLLGALFLTSCGGGGGDDPAPVQQTDAEKIANTWRIQEAYVNDQRTGTFEGGTFRVTFTVDAGQSGGTYSVVNENGVPRPDYNNGGATTGSWSFNSPTISFTHGTTQSGVTVIGAVSTDRVEIQWTLPDPDSANPGGDKTNPTYRYILVPAS